MELSAVPEALVTIRAARDKMEGKSESKGELTHYLERVRESGENPNSAKHLQDKVAARTSKSTCHECEQRCHWAGDPQCPGTRDTYFITWPDDQMFPDREDHRAIMMVERIAPFGVFSSLFKFLREHSVCTGSASNLRYFLVDAHIPVSCCH